MGVFEKAGDGISLIFCANVRKTLALAMLRPLSLSSRTPLGKGEKKDPR